MLVHIGSCLALLSVAHCASIQKVASVELIDHHCQEIPPGKIMFPGSGIKANYRPYYLTTISSDRTPIELYSSSGDHCTLNIPGFGSPRYEVFQASPKIVYLTENEIFQAIRRRVLSVDMSTCTVHDLREKNPGKRADDWVLFTIYYEDGYDEIYRENNTGYRRSLDVAGNEIGQARTFLLDSLRYSVRHQTLPTSPKSRTSNIIVVAYDPRRVKADGGTEMYVNLVDAGNRLIKNLLTFEYFPHLRLPVVHDFSDSAYTFCYNGKNDYECAQFDQSDNEVFRNSLSYSSRTSAADNVHLALLSVRNLKDGPGFVLFTATYERTTDPMPADAPRNAAFTSPVIANVVVTEMRPGKTIENSYRLANKQYHPVTVTDYDEVSGRFTVQEGLYQSKNICWSTFSLAAKHE